MSDLYERAMFIRNGLRPLHISGAGGLPPDPLVAGPAAEREGAEANGYSLVSLTGSGRVSVNVTERCYRGLLRYESPLYDTDRSLDHSTDVGSVQVCTRRADEEGQLPVFTELSVFLFGDSANHLKQSAPGEVSPGKCVVYNTVGEVITNAVRVNGSSSAAHTGVDINNGKFVIYSATGSTEIQGTLTVGGDTRLSNTLTVSGEAKMENNLIAMGEVRAEQFIAVSDQRLKQNITELDGKGALQVVMQLRPTQYQMRSSPNEDRCGLLAQEVRDVIPSCVVPHPTHGEEKDPFLGVNYTDVVAYMIGAVRELSRQVDLLSQQVDKLSSSPSPASPRATAPAAPAAPLPTARSPASRLPPQ